jgi:hypothetical protein
VAAPINRQELARVPAEVPGVHLVNMVEGGITPPYGRDEFATLRFTLILYANFAVRAGPFGARAALQEIRTVGSSIGIMDRMFTWMSAKISYASSSLTWLRIGTGSAMPVRTELLVPATYASVSVAEVNAAYVDVARRGGLEVGS